MSESIKFYSVGDDYGEFSNFAPFALALDKKKWPTSEHYFQAQKFLDPKDREEVRRASSPHIAARLGRDRKKKLRKDWESAKVGIMRRALEAKFTQHEELGRLLLSTGSCKLIEHTPNDDYWGDGGDGLGKNMLGRLLMEVREKLRGEQRARPNAGSASAPPGSVT
jgi:N-glycosidase YbiA